MSDLLLLDGKAQLSEQLVNMLNAKAGDRIVIGYTSLNGTLVPVISLGDGGNKLSGKNTFVFKGKQRDALANYGTEFEAVDGNPITLKGDKPEFKVFTAMENAVEYVVSKQTILDKNFDITIYNNYEF